MCKLHPNAPRMQGMKLITLLSVLLNLLHLRPGLLQCNSPDLDFECKMSRALFPKLITQKRYYFAENECDRQELNFDRSDRAETSSRISKSAEEGRAGDCKCQCLTNRPAFSFLATHTLERLPALILQFFLNPSLC